MKQKWALRLNFDRRLLLQFRGSVITSDGGLLAYRELEDTFGLTDKGARKAGGRAHRQERPASAGGLLRQSVFGRLAGYEDVNDAERLCRDPAMRWVVGDRAITGYAASASQMGRFETKWLCRAENLAALADLPGQWIDKVHQRRPPKMIVLDMDSSESPTYGEQEGSAYNGHFGCTCYHPLFVFNQFGDLERCAPAARQRAQRRWLARAAGAGDRPLPGQREAPLFPGRRGLRQPRDVRVPRSRGLRLCDPAAGQSTSCRTRSGTCSSARSGDRRTRYAATTPASPIRRRAGTSRATSWPRSNGIRASCTRRVGFIVSNLPRSAEGIVAFYNQRGTCEQYIKEGKNAIKWTRLSCRTFAANAVRLQLHALAYNLGNFMRTLAMPKTAEPWSLTSLREKLIKIGAKVVSHGRYVTFQMAEVAVPRQMFADILSLIARLRAPPAPA